MLMKPNGELPLDDLPPQEKDNANAKDDDAVGEIERDRDDGEGDVDVKRRDGDASAACASPLVQQVRRTQALLASV